MQSCSCSMVFKSWNCGWNVAQVVMVSMKIRNQRFPRKITGNKGESLTEKRTAEMMENLNLLNTECLPLHCMLNFLRTYILLYVHTANIFYILTSEYLHPSPISP
jgi:hypothetical protein